MAKTELGTPKGILEARIARLEKELHEYYLVEKVIIAAGLLSEEKFQQAREIVRGIE